MTVGPGAAASQAAGPNWEEDADQRQVANQREVVTTIEPLPVYDQQVSW
jgi:hypothetical protein